MATLKLNIPGLSGGDDDSQQQRPPAPPPPPPPPLNFAQFASNPLVQQKIAAVVPGLPPVPPPNVQGPPPPAFGPAPAMSSLPPPSASQVNGPPAQSMQDWQQQNPQMQEQKTSGIMKALQIAAGLIGGGVPGGAEAGMNIHQHDLPANLAATDQQRYQQAVVQPYTQGLQQQDIQAQMQQRMSAANKSDAQADDFTPFALNDQQAQMLGMPGLSGTMMTPRDYARLSGVRQTTQASQANTQTRANATTTAATTKADATTSAAQTRAGATVQAAAIRGKGKGGGAAGGGKPSGMSDDEYVKGIGEGRIPAPRGKWAAGIMERVAKQYPNFDASTFGTHQASEKDFTSGADSHAVNSFNTALQHLGRAEQNMPANSGLPAYNTVHNAFLRASGDASLTNFDTDRTAVSAEIAKAYKGGVINKEEHDEYQRLLDPNASPAQMKNSFGELKQLLSGKLESYNYQRSQGRPAASGSASVMSPGASQVMNEGKSFNATKWAAAHPDKDVNAAIKKAQQQGYKVTQ